MTASHRPTTLDALLAEREWMRALARSLVTDTGLADDVVQQTWLAATLTPPDDASSPRAWLGTVLRHFVQRARRGDRRRGLREMAASRPEAMPSAADMVARAETHRHLVDAVIALEEPYRSTVLARFFEDMPPREIARRMDVPVETVRTRLKRGLAQLRARLDAEYGGDGKAWGIALVPLAANGVIVKGTTKAGIVAAAVALLAGAGTYTWRDADVTSSPAPRELSVVEPASQGEPTSVVAKAQPADEGVAGSGAVHGEVWFAEPDKPAAGIAVAIGPADSSRVVRTDDAGRFRLEGLPGAFRGSVRVRHEGFGEVVRRVEPLEDGEQHDTGILRLAAAVSAEVFVLTFDGDAVPGATVEAWRTPAKSFSTSVVDEAAWRDVPEPSASLTTDAAGHVRFDALERTSGAGVSWVFVAGKSGSTTTASPPIRLATKGKATTVRIRVGAAFAVSGRVVDVNGNGVAGIVVWARSGAQRGADQVAGRYPHATSGADGRFAIEGLADGAYSLRVQRGTLPPVDAVSVRVPLTSPVEIVLAGRRITGTVRDAATGGPLDGVTVRASAFLTGTGQACAFRALSGPDGKFVLDTVVDVASVNYLKGEKAGWVEVPDPARKPRQGMSPTVTLSDSGDTTLRITMRRAVRVVGRVTMDGDIPVRGAEVVLARQDGTMSGTATDTDGRYVFDGVESGLAFVCAMAEGLNERGRTGQERAQFQAGQAPPGTVSVPETGDVTHDVAMERRTTESVAVAGRVIDESGAPVAGAEVVDTVTGADGAFQGRCDLWRGRREVRLGGARIRMLRPDDDPPASGELTGIEVKLVAPRRLRIRVVTAVGTPRGGWVQWRQVWPGQSARDAEDKTWSDAQRLPLSSGGLCDVALPNHVEQGVAARAGAPGFAPATVVPKMAEDGAYEAEIGLERSVTFTGRVLLADTRQPCAEVRIVIVPPPDPPHLGYGRAPSRRPVVAVTDAEGRFTVTDAAPGLRCVHVERDGFLSAEVDVDVADGREVVLELTRGEEISGRVVSVDGTPVAAYLQITGGSAMTDPEGRFVARYLPAGPVTITALPNDESYLRAVVSGIAAGSRDVRIVVERRGRGLLLKGRVVGADGTPVGFADVSAAPLSSSTGKAYGRATTAADGSFEIGDLDDVEYVVHAAPPRPSRRSDVDNTVEGARWLSGKTEAVRPPRGDVIVTLAEGDTIEGVLVDASGVPLAHHWVRAEIGAERTQFQDWLGAQTDAAGQFVITGLRPSAYRLTVPIHESRREPAPLLGGESVKSGTRGLRLTPGRYMKIRGAVVGEGGKPVAGASVRLIDASGDRNTKTDDAGAFEFGSLVPGAQFEAVAWMEKSELAPTVLWNVAAGSEGVRIALSPGLRSSGRLLDAEGKPVASAQFTLSMNANPVDVRVHTDREGRFEVTGLLPGHYRVAWIKLVDTMYRPVSCGMLDAGATDVELRPE